MPGAYIPPHKRNAPGGAAPATTSTTSSSSTFSRTSGRFHASNTRGGNQSNKNNNNKPPPPPPPPSSRFSDLSFTTNTNTNSNKSSRRKMPAQDAAVPVKYAFFGDSFIRMFDLIRHDAVYVRGFKGASAKGLGRHDSDNDNRLQIARYMQQHADTLERCIFSFGSVDVHLSYYYKKYVLEQDIDLEDIARQYVAFVASLLSTTKTTTTTTSSSSSSHYQSSSSLSLVECIILGVYPSPLEDDDVAASLRSYGSLGVEQGARVAASTDVQLQVRQERVQAFNRVLAEECERYNNNSINDNNNNNKHRCRLVYIDCWKEMVDKGTWRIREAYRDVSDQNIHVVWETTILLWLDKWPWLKDLVTPSFQAKLNETLKKYLATKPWAERTHVSQN